MKQIGDPRHGAAQLAARLAAGQRELGAHS
jgi:hypothetical protein